MKRRLSLRLWIGTIILLLVSLLAAFFIVFNSVFSDVTSISDRVITYVLTTVVYLVLGFLSGLAGPTRPRRWLYILSIPPIVLLIVYTFSEPQNILIHASFAALVPLATYAGLRAGRRLRAPKTVPGTKGTD